MPTAAPAATRLFTEADLWGRDGRPAANDVEQKRIGDCYFVGVAGAVAEQTPDQIRKAITYRPESGNFYVGLYQDGAWKGVEVTQAELRDNLSDKALLGSSSFGSASREVDGGLWPAVYEIGYAKLRWGDWEQGKEKLNEGGNPADALEAITGKRPLVLTADAIAEAGPRAMAAQINQALQDDKRIVLGTNEDPTVWENLKARMTGGEARPGAATDGLAGNHIYMVVGARYDTTADDTVLTLRNPWSHNTNEGLPFFEQELKNPRAEIEVSLKSLLQENTRSLNRIDIGQLSAPQRGLYESIKEQVGEGASEAAIALATVQASREGITSAAQLRGAALTEEGRLMVAGMVPGQRTVVDTTQPLPPIQESLQQLVQEAQRQESMAVQQQAPMQRGLG